jgi:hypothetical protein
MTPPLDIADVQDLIGKPYRPGARGPHEFDCWGLCAEVYRRRGIALPDYEARGLSHAQTLALVQGHATNHAEWIDKPEPWCFVFDATHGHLGLYWGGSVLHCARMVGVIWQRLAQFLVIYPHARFARWIE